MSVHCTQYWIFAPLNYWTMVHRCLRPFAEILRWINIGFLCSVNLLNELLCCRYLIWEWRLRRFVIVLHNDMAVIWSGFLFFIHIQLKINFILDIILSVSVTTVPIHYLYICKLFASNCVYAWRHFWYVMRVINEYSFWTLVHRLIIKLTNICIYHWRDSSITFWMAYNS